MESLPFLGPMDATMVPSRYLVNFDKSLAQRQRRSLSFSHKLDRRELEEKYDTVYDENLFMKKFIRLQEDRMKKMATKLLRLSEERRRDSQFSPYSSERVINNEEVDKLRIQLNSYVQENAALKDKNFRMKEQLASVRRIRQGSFNRGDSNRSFQQRSGSSLQRSKMISRDSSGKDEGIEVESRSLGDSKLEKIAIIDDAKAQIKNLHDALRTADEKLEEYEAVIRSLNEKLSMQEKRYASEIDDLKAKMSEAQKTKIGESIDMIRLRREVNEKSVEICSLKNQYKELLKDFEFKKVNDNHYMLEIERLKTCLKVEEQKNAALAARSHMPAINTAEVEELRHECELLKVANENLLNQAFNLDQSKYFKERESFYKTLIKQLETTIQTMTDEKTSLIEHLSQEKESNIKLKQECIECKSECMKLKEKFEAAENKAEQETNLSACDLQQAVKMFTERKLDELKIPANESVKELIQEGKAERRILELESLLSETSIELDKTRRLLVTQHQINDECNTKIEELKNDLKNTTTDYEKKVAEFSNLLESRTNKLSKLEAQVEELLKKLEKAERIQKINRADSDHGKSNGSKDQVVHEKLEDKDNMSEPGVHSLSITKLKLPSNDRQLAKSFSLKFLIKNIKFASDFYANRSIKTGSVIFLAKFLDSHVKKICIIDNILSEVNLDFVFPVPSNSNLFSSASCITVELYKTKELANPLGICHCDLKTLCVNNGEFTGDAHITDCTSEGHPIGAISYYIGLESNTDCSFNSLKTEFEKYVSTSSASGSTIEDNEVVITIIGCNDLRAFKSTDKISYVCIAYKFFNFEEHNTKRVESVVNPFFNDVKCYSVRSDIKLTRYLLNTQLCLNLYETDTSRTKKIFGKAMISLIPLAKGLFVAGSFDINDLKGVKLGYVSLSMYWRYPFSPSKDSLIHLQPQHQVKENAQSSSSRILLSSKDLDKAKVTAADKDNRDDNSSADSGRVIRQKSSSMLELYEVAKVLSKPSEEISPAANSNHNLTNTYAINQNTKLETSISSSTEEESDFVDIYRRRILAKDSSEQSSSQKDDVNPSSTTTFPKEGPRDLSIIIEVFDLKLNERCAIFNLPNYTEIYIVVDVPSLSKEVESVDTHPKGKPNEVITFNMKQRLDCSRLMHHPEVFKLKNIDEKSKKKFMVSFYVMGFESPDGGEDIISRSFGFADVYLNDIVANNSDIVDAKIKVYDDEKTSVVIGRMKISLRALKALKSILKIAQPS